MAEMEPPQPTRLRRSAPRGAARAGRPQGPASKLALEAGAEKRGTGNGERGTGELKSLEVERLRVGGGQQADNSKVGEQGTGNREQGTELRQEWRSTEREIRGTEPANQDRRTAPRMARGWTGREKLKSWEVEVGERGRTASGQQQGVAGAPRPRPLWPNAVRPARLGVRGLKELDPAEELAEG